MAIVLLRGLGREAGHWADFPDRLMASVHAERLFNLGGVKTPDIPGCGRHYQHAVAHSIANMVDFVRNEVVSVNSGEKHIVVGLSMGGMLALDWARKYPQDVLGVVLINSSASCSPFWQRLSPKALPTLFAALMRTTQKREELLLSLVSNSAAARKRHLEVWQTIQREHPVSRRKFIQLLTAVSRYELPERLSCPGRVLCSRSDQLVSHQCSRSIAEALAWPLCCHDWAGHDIAIDDPDWLLGEIGRFTQSLVMT